MGLAGARTTTETMLMAMMVDALNILVWMQTKDGAKGRNRPDSVLEKLTAAPREPEHKTFRTPEDFMKYWDRSSGTKNGN